MQDARCLKVKARERAFKQFKSPVLNVLNSALGGGIQPQAPTILLPGELPLQALNGRLCGHQSSPGISGDRINFVPYQESKHNFSDHHPLYTGVLISPWSDPTEKKNWKFDIFRPTRRSLLLRTPVWTDNFPIFFFEWLAKVRVWSLQLVSFLVGLRTYQHPGTELSQVYITMTERLPFLFEYSRNPFQGKLQVMKGKQRNERYFPAKQKSVLKDSNLDEIDLLVSQQAVVSP